MEEVGVSGRTEPIRLESVRRSCVYLRLGRCGENTCLCVRKTENCDELPHGTLWSQVLVIQNGAITY